MCQLITWGGKRGGRVQGVRGVSREREREGERNERENERAYDTERGGIGGGGGRWRPLQLHPQSHSYRL